MFSQELENLIHATLEDGILEENEKAALVKRAQREGVDLDELEIYINSLLQKRQRELNEKKDALEKKYEKEKKEAFGQVCPNCGKQVPPLTLKCDCGYEFTKSKTASSMQVLSEKLNAVSLTRDEIKEIDDAADGEKEGKRSKYLTDKKIEIITTFPVPNTKEDIIDFLSVSVSSANKKLSFFDTKKGVLSVFGGIILACLIVTIFIPLYMAMVDFIVIGWGAIFYSTKQFSEERLKNTWRAKYEQVIMKGRSLRGDPEFTQQLDYYENLLKEK